jgi:pimeloyl-ACP methyl ester carboxylesterase
MPYAPSGDAKIYYEVHGAGPGVLFVHGSGGHHVAWWQQVAALSGSDTVFTVDLRGFGNSRWEADHDARNFSGDIIAVLDAVAASGGPSRVVLVGQSIGAAGA